MQQILIVNTCVQCKSSVQFKSNLQFSFYFLLFVFSSIYTFVPHNSLTFFSSQLLFLHWRNWQRYWVIKDSHLSNSREATEFSSPFQYRVGLIAEAWIDFLWAEKLIRKKWSDSPRMQRRDMSELSLRKRFDTGRFDGSEKMEKGK